MPFLHNTELLLSKMKFICRHTKHVKVSPEAVESDFLMLSFPKICESEFYCQARVLNEIAENSAEYTVECSEGRNKIFYKYSVGKENFNRVDVKKFHESISSLKFVKNFNNVISTVCIGPNIFKCLTDENVFVELHDNKLVISSDSIVSTRYEMDCRIIEGKSNFRCKVPGHRLRIVDEFSDGQLSLSYFENCILICRFEELITVGCYAPVVF